MMASIVPEKRLKRSRTEETKKRTFFERRVKPLVFRFSQSFFCARACGRTHDGWKKMEDTRGHPRVWTLAGWLGGIPRRSTEDDPTRASRSRKEGGGSGGGGGGSSGSSSSSSSTSSSTSQGQGTEAGEGQSEGGAGREGDSRRSRALFTRAQHHREVGGASACRESGGG